MLRLPNGVGTLENGLIASGLPAPKGLIQGERVLDIGAGLRPMPWYTPKMHLCVEPHPPYAERLQAAGYDVITDHALNALKFFAPKRFDSIFMIDVIEHLERNDGWNLLRAAHRLEPTQIVVFTPDGFLPQEGDAWGLGGEEWQRHRSGWTHADFPDWNIQPYNGMQFFAVWTRQ